jgi:acyl carrier protein phosphodiesterase
LNHLAHFLLAPHTRDATVGTLLADFHRGAVSADLPGAIADAIRLHRAIDSETDRHPTVHALKATFGTAERRFAGLALDLYFDHCLVRDWPRHAEIEFDAFVDATYERLITGLPADYVPERMRGFATAMCDQDWLRSYREFAGVEAALGRLNGTFRRRFGRIVELRPLADELQRLQPHCDAAFAALFTHLHQKMGSGSITARK